MPTSKNQITAALSSNNNKQGTTNKEQGTPKANKKQRTTNKERRRPTRNKKQRIAFSHSLIKRQFMLDINKTYVTNSKKQPIAVQIDIKTFDRIEQILEDYALGKFIEENDPKDNLTLNEAEEWYRKLKTRKSE